MQDFNVKGLRTPAQAGVQGGADIAASRESLVRGWTPAFAGVRRTGSSVRAALAGAALIALVTPGAALAQGAYPVGGNDDAMHAGQLDVPVNKSQIVRADRPFSKALIGNQEIADVLPMSGSSLYVLGKKAGTTSLTLYDRGNNLISVIDVAVGPDVVGLRRQLNDLMPNEKISARMSNESVVLSGIVSSGPAAQRAQAIATTYAGDKVVNMLSVGASQQVMLEVRFSEINRAAAKQIGFNHSYIGNKSYGSIGNLAKDSVVATNQTFGGPNPGPVITIDGLADAFGVGTLSTTLGSIRLFSALDALERKGMVKTLAEPNLVALSGETASFLAGGEFPIPVLQGNNNGGGGSGGGNNGGGGITVEFKPFGVSLGFTPTVLDDGVISLVVAPEVSSIDPSASVVINGLTVPGLLTRRAKTTVELRDGESFAIAGLLRNDFSNTVRQIPLLGSLPIIGTLFRSTGFQKEESELVIIVTPRLVKPMRPDQVRLPTDRVGTPDETELFLLGRTDKAVPVLQGPDGDVVIGKSKAPAPAGRPVEKQATKPETGFEGPVGHEL
jgi:pilus assembly protein CpaC